MGSRITKEQAEAMIRQTAVEDGDEDLADILVAIAIAETGLDIYKPGDNGHSWGPFHENDGGRGAGLSIEERQNVPNATRRAIAELRQKQKEFPGVSPGKLAVEAQRPAQQYRPGYVSKVDSIVNDYTQNGDPNRNTPNGSAISPRPPNQSGATKISNPAGGGQQSYAFPVRGYQGGPIPAHWGSADKGARGGADIFAPVGTPIQSMSGGTVLWVDSGDSAGGNNVGIKGDDGNTYYYAHMRDPSGLKQGQRVDAGTDIGVVGNTGNAAGTPSHLHIGIGKGIQTGTGPLGGMGKDFDATTLLNQSLKGGAGYVAGAGGLNTVADTTRELTPTDVEALIKQRLENDATLNARRADAKKAADKAAGFDTEATQAQNTVKSLQGKYGPNGPVEGKWEHANRLKPGETDRRNTPVLGGIQGLDPNQWEPNPDYQTDLAGYKNAEDLDAQTRVPNSQWNRDRTTAIAQANQQAESVRDETTKLEASERTRLNDLIQSKRGIVHSNTDTGESWLIDPTTGNKIQQLPNVGIAGGPPKPGDKFISTGQGIFKIGPNDTLTLVDGTAGIDTTTTEIADPLDNTKTIIRLINKKTGDRIADYPKAIDPSTLVKKPIGDINGPKILMYDPTTKTYTWETNQAYKPAAGTQVTGAGRDVPKIGQFDPATGTIKWSDNENYDPKAGGKVEINQTTGYGYQFDKDGTLIKTTDMLSPKDRELYNRGKTADVGKTEADTLTAWGTAAKSAWEQQLAEAQRKTWENAQKIANTPGATRDDIIAAIASGAKDADEYTKIWTAHISQRTQEEVARNNRVTAGINLQNADRQLREGLYKDINDTRNQRTLAQAQSNAAIKDSGIIGEANSMNVLSAMAPQVGLEGVARAGTVGLGVGAGAIEPVQDQYQDHLTEIENLRKQMPSVRLADINLDTPSFAMPTSKPGQASPVVSVGDNPVIKEIKDRIRGLATGTKPASTAPDGSPVTAGGTPQIGVNGVQDTPQGPRIGTPIAGAGVSIATGKSQDEINAEAEAKKKELEMAGAGGMAKRHSFRVPQARKKVAA